MVELTLTECVVDCVASESPPYVYIIIKSVSRAVTNIETFASALLLPPRYLSYRSNPP